MAAGLVLDAMLHANSSPNLCKKVLIATIYLLIILRSACLQRLRFVLRENVSDETSGRNAKRIGYVPVPENNSHSPNCYQCRLQPTVCISFKYSPPPNSASCVSDRVKAPGR